MKKSRANDISKFTEPNRAVQYFSDEYLEECKKMTPDQILEFIENYRLLNFNPKKTKLISLRAEENVLNVFKGKAKLEGISYQKKIKELMLEWLTGEVENKISKILCRPRRGRHKIRKT